MLLKLKGLTCLALYPLMRDKFQLVGQPLSEEVAQPAILACLHVVGGQRADLDHDCRLDYHCFGHLW